MNWYDPKATKCADKYEVRDIVIERIGSEYLNELIAVYNSVDEIDLDILPDKFVLKGTHGSGFNIICKDKNEMDWRKEFSKMRRWLRKDYHLQKRELVYENIKPRIICERYIDTEDAKSLWDYKIFCFDGEPKSIFLCKDRGNNTTFDFYDLDWNLLNIKNHYPNSGVIENKPKRLNEMLELARKLSKGFPHARVDFYYEKEKIIFGEITFFHFSGMEKFEPESFDLQMGNWLKLPQKQDAEVNKK